MRNNRYNDLNRLTATHIEMDGVIQAKQEFSYDNRGRVNCSATRMNPASSGPACTLSPEGAYGPDRITKYEYDTASRVTKTFMAYGTDDESVETADYYKYGPVKHLHDGKGNQTLYTYDGFRRPLVTKYAKASGNGTNNNDYVQYYYDSDGTLSATRQRDGQIINQTVDNAGRVTQIDAPGTADDISFTYDIAGQMTSVTKARKTLGYSYDNYGRLLSETSENGTISYQYDSSGNRTRMTYPGADNFHITYEYRGGQLSKIRENGTSILASYAYDAQGRRTSIMRGNNVMNRSSYSYDAAERLESMSMELSGTAADQTVSFDYNAQGQISSQTNSNPIYDPLILSLNVQYRMNGLNQIHDMHLDRFRHDTAGNLKSARGKNYGYDSANRLTSISNGTNISATLSYDPLARLSSLTSGGVTTGFAYDGQDMIAEYEDNVLKKRYVHGPGIDEPIAEYDGTSLDETYLIADVRGSIIAHASRDGTSLATNRYEIYGKPSTSNTGRFQYTGQVWLGEIGLYYYKARFYDPDIRRFLTPDPIGYAAGMNMYAYVNGDPVNLVDPTGLFGELGSDVFSTAPRTYFGEEDHFNIGDESVFDYLYDDSFESGVQVAQLGGAIVNLACSLTQGQAEFLASENLINNQIKDAYGQNALINAIWQNNSYPWRSAEIGVSGSPGFMIAGSLTIATHVNRESGEHLVSFGGGIGVGAGVEGHAGVGFSSVRPGGFGYEISGTTQFLHAGFGQALSAQGASGATFTGGAITAVGGAITGQGTFTSAASCGSIN